MSRPDEIARIRTEYARRAREVSVEDLRVRLFIRQMRERPIVAELTRALSRPLAECRVLDVGCGDGQWLADFETWGVPPGSIAGIELDAERAAAAHERLSAADIREGDASELPWPDGSFDVVLQATMLSSILDPDLRRRIASEMARVVAPGGVVVSYDMRVRNPRNDQIRPVGKGELHELFEGLEVRTRRVTLLVPLSRRVVPLSWGLASLLERARLLDTHLLAVMRRPGAPG